MARESKYVVGEAELPIPSRQPAPADKPKSIGNSVDVRVFFVEKERQVANRNEGGRLVDGRVVRFVVSLFVLVPRGDRLLNERKNYEPRVDREGSQVISWLLLAPTVNVFLFETISSVSQP